MKCLSDRLLPRAACSQQFQADCDLLCYCWESVVLYVLMGTFYLKIGRMSWQKFTASAVAEDQRRPGSLCLSRGHWEPQVELQHYLGKGIKRLSSFPSSPDLCFKDQTPHACHLLSYLFQFLRQPLVLQPRLALSSPSSKLNPPPSAGITGTQHYVKILF